MSTDINIKKRITILEESAILTKDVNSIDFVGAGVVASTIGDDVTVTIGGGVGAITYYLNQTVTQAPYKEFSSIVTTAVEQLVPLTVAGGVTSVIAEYQTPVGVPGSTQIAAGLWSLYLHFNAAIAGQNWIIRPTVWKRDLGGIETLLFTSDPIVVTNMATVTTMYLSDGVFPATTLLTTDRLVVRISMENTTGVSQTVTFRTEGSQHYSVATTTLNPTYNPSAVTSVTGTAPVVSSGGTTPAISMAQSSAIADGYLSSSDFAVFNAKVGGSGTTNYLSKFTGTGTIGNSQTQDDGANIAVNGAILSAYKFAVYSTTPGENYNIYGNTTVNGAVGVAGVNQGVGASTNYGTSGTAQSSTALNIGVYGQATGASAENVGGKFSAILATTNYSVQLQDGTEGVGKVLTSMTADGKAQWAALAAAAGLIYITNQTTGVVTYYTTLELARDGSVSGDTIYVNTGTYVVTTTAANGLSKSGVNWYFEPGAAVSKATSGHIFSDNGFTLNANVYGLGTFTKTTTTGNIFYNTLANAIFEARAVISSIDDCFVTTTANNLYFNVNRATSSGGRVLHIAGSSTSRIKIDMVLWKSTAANCIGGATWWYNTDVKVNGGLLESTTAQAVGNYNSGVVLDLNITKILGVTYAVSSGDGGNGYPNIINCSYCTGIYDVGKNYILNGQFGALYYGGSNGAFVNGGRFSTITLAGGGHVITTLGTNLTLPSTGTITQSSGVLDVTIDTFHYGIGFNITGGVCNIVNQSVQNQLSGALDRIVNGGTLNLYTNFIHGGNPDSGVWYAIKLQSGTLRLLASVRNNFNTAASNIGAHGIVWVGGKLIIDRSTIYITDTVALPIQATTAGLSLRVLTGGLSTNITADGGVLPGKKMKYKFTISAIAATGINILIPTSYNISESNTGVYNTKALLAQRMAALINGSPFLNVAVIATQDTPGIDEYFYIETLTAGPTFSYNTPVNFLAITIQRWNSYAITNLTGGSILENINVE